MKRKMIYSILLTVTALKDRVGQVVCAHGIGERVRLNEQQTFRKWWR